MDGRLLLRKTGKSMKDLVEGPIDMLVFESPSHDQSHEAYEDVQLDMGIQQT